MSGSFYTYRGTRFHHVRDQLKYNLLNQGLPVEAVRWQSTDISDKPEMRPIELECVTVLLPIDASALEWTDNVQPNQPWAEEHFRERVSGVPHNPPPSHEIWPFARHDNDEFRRGGKFSHTYPERFWPKRAQPCIICEDNPSGRPLPVHPHLDMRGIHFDYGDLADVVSLLERDPATRQAVLPVWFPEDTGVVHGERVPCSLHYQFLVRQGHMDMVYSIRSCDFVRHFTDDVYLAGRLCQWVCGELSHDVEPGVLVMHVGSLHCFEGDLPMMRKGMV